jgi:hypothetical protein
MVSLLSATLSLRTAKGDSGSVDFFTRQVRVTRRRSFLFLSACVEGETAHAKVADQVATERGLLEHAAEVRRLFDELLTGGRAERRRRGSYRNRVGLAGLR